MIRSLSLTLGLALLPLQAIADTYDFGGFEDEFKGGGDKTPPQCQIDAPRAATSPFFIKWNCSDDVASPDTIRTELWITRQGEDIASRKIEEFLGFPAAAFIDENQLRAETFTEGLPVSFRLLARDTAGNAALSEIITIRSQDTTLSKCSLNVLAEGTESSGGTTGTPAMRVALLNAPVLVTLENNFQTTNISTAEPTAASPCEIDTICLNGDEINFSSRVTAQSNGTASGTVTIPGAVFAELTGTATVNSGVVTALELNGETEVDNKDATVTLSCSR